jgi:hypothetical protein
MFDTYVGLQRFMIDYLTIYVPSIKAISENQYQ